MAVSMMSIGASAAGSVTFSSYNSSTKTIYYSYNVTGSSGATSSKSFTTTSGTQGMHYSTSSAAGAKITFSFSGGSTTITVPKQTSGMPSTIYTTISLKDGATYTPKVVPDPTSSSVSGTFDVSNTTI